MKKLVALLMAAALGVSLALCGCGSKDEASSDEEKISGGWTVPDSVEVTDEVKTVLNKATKEMTGADYEPVAYLGSQVVAGTNYRILCKVSPVVPNAESTYAIVTVYENLEGKAEITEVLNSEVKAYEWLEDADGSWTPTESPALTEEATKSLQKSVEKMTGAYYEPVALLGTQVVAGTNYSLLCQVTPVAENAETHYSIVVVYNGADGTTSVVETHDFSSDAE